MSVNHIIIKTKNQLKNRERITVTHPTQSATTLERGEKSTIIPEEGHAYIEITSSSNLY